MNIVDNIKACGVTGTQDGATPQQERSFGYLLGLWEIERFHHGDCVGADAQTHAIVRKFENIKIHIHPPVKDIKRAFCTGDIVYEVRAYLARNHDIVNAVDVLIALPKGFGEELRSGTWATVRYARRKRIPICIIWPDGRIDAEVF